MRFKNKVLMLLSLLSCLFSLPSYSQNGGSWEQWVADRHPDLNCPWLIASNERKICNWPGEFVGKILEDGMIFEMSVQVFSQDVLLNLPGSRKNWPTALTVNQLPAAVIDSNGIPRVHLKKGTNIIRGKFLWQEIPATLSLPETIGLVKILRNGQVLPTSINNNQLILSSQKKLAQLDNQNSLKVQVYRAIEDAVPIRLITIIKLFVSGKAREVSIGSVAIAGSKTLYLRSALPARLEEDGMLRIQVKPGIYQITVGSRFSDNITSISTNKISSEWPQAEYFSFIAASRIREVKISGVKSIDTSLLDIPTQWKVYPTYRLEKSDKLQLKTIVSGDNATHQNSINITRDIWLSFDGKDAIAKDNISGKMDHGWRLDAAKSVRLGRASVNSIPVLITHFQGNEGVEIRSPQINLQAVSSIPLVNKINAVGWQTDAATLSARIHLPPGWRAVHASGVDGISGTWLQKWNLWDIFWLMILIAVSNKLLGFKAALLMALTLIFTFHEEQAPNALWAILLSLIAIISLPIGRYKVLLSRLALLPAALLIITFIGIAISSLRLAIYPTLEKHAVNNYQVSSKAYQQNAMPEVSLSMQQARDVAVRSSRESKGQSYNGAIPKEKQDWYQVGDNDRVQTGPGIPRWSWNSLTINSSGTVTANQQIHLILSTPLLTATWRIITVLLIGLMGAIMLRKLFSICLFKNRSAPLIAASLKKDKHLNSTLPVIVITLLVQLASVCILFSPHTADAAINLPKEQGYPPEYLLKEYENRLLQVPSCLPSCVALDNGLLVVKDNLLTLNFTLFADADIAMPLPSAGDAWLADKITIDSKPAVLRTTQGMLTVYLPKGRHSISMSGTVNNSEITINLPVNIHNFRVDAPSWLIDGVRKGVVVNNNISLTSKEVLVRQDANTLAPLPVKSYAIVHRSITLGKQWKMLTRVEKVAPAADVGSFNITLLEGEQILSAYPVNENGNVNVQIPKNQHAISWESALPQTDVINLKAANKSSYSETWQVLPSSIWNVRFDGINPIKSELGSGQLQPTWKPWPGESLACRTCFSPGTRPEAQR